MSELTDRELLMRIWSKMEMCHSSLEDCSVCHNNIGLMKQLKKRLGIEEKIDLNYHGVII